MTHLCWLSRKTSTQTNKSTEKITIAPDKKVINCRLLCHLLVILNFISANSVDPDQTAPLRAVWSVGNSVDPDQTAPLGAVWSGPTLFACMQK